MLEDYDIDKEMMICIYYRDVSGWKDQFLNIAFWNLWFTMGWRIIDLSNVTFITREWPALLLQGKDSHIPAFSYCAPCPLTIKLDFVWCFMEAGSLLSTNFMLLVHVFIPFITNIPVHSIVILWGLCVASTLKESNIPRHGKRGPFASTPRGKELVGPMKCASPSRP